jgi:pyrimidine operon attenuation protein/uracil phosphoribosyltransferase
MDAEGMRRALTRIAHEILEHNGGAEGLIFVGVRTRGEPIARRVAALVKQFEGVEVPCFSLDTTHYRDDRRRPKDQPAALPDDSTREWADRVEGGRIVLVDDVFYTGRTVRAAIDAIVDMGRPSSIQLAALVDRGHRELPIRADYTGKNVPTSRAERIRVRLVETDGVDEVLLVRSSAS